MGQQRKQTIGVDIEALIQQEEEAAKKRQQAKRQEEIAKLRAKKKASGKKAPSKEPKSPKAREESSDSKQSKGKRPALRHPRNVYGRSRRYLASRRQIDKNRHYPVREAVELLGKIVRPAGVPKLRVNLIIFSARRANKPDNESLKLSLPYPVGKKKTPGLKCRFDRSGSLFLKIGEISWKPEKLAQNLQFVLGAIPRKDLSKAFVCAPHLPSLKLETK